MKISRSPSLAVLATAFAVTFQAVGPAMARTDLQDDVETTVSGSYLAARFASSERDNDAAITHLRNLLKLDADNPEVVERTFIATLVDGQIDDAVALARRLVEIDSNNRLARLTLGVNAMRKKHYRTARSNLALSVSGPIGDLTATLLAGWSFLGSGQPKNATTVIERLKGPEWYGGLKALNAGLILQVAGKDKEAGKLLRQAAELDPNSLRAVEAYARWVSRNEDPKAALAIFNALDSRLQRHPMVKQQTALLESGKTLPAMVTTPQQGAAQVLYDLGTLLARQGGEDLALVYLQLATWLNPEHPFGYLTLAELYEQLKQPEKAIAAYRLVPASSPMKREAEIQLAVNLDATDKFDEAQEHLKALVASQPDDPDAIIALGRIQQGRKKFAECADSYASAIKLIKTPGQSNWPLFYLHGICNERAENWPTAEASLKKALELEPDQPHVLNYLGYSWVDQGIHLDEGLGMIRKAVALRPDDGPIVDSLGWAYYRLGRYQEAVDELEHAVELMPQDPVLNDHLGDAYWKVGRKLEAGFQWNHARDLKPEPDVLEKIEKKIKLGLDAAEAPAPVKKAEDVKKTDDSSAPR
ncbi:MAG: tetratricopeptide repeat protein [Xanthobacter sp.]